MIIGWVETPDLVPCHVFDATGMEIMRITRADTETGECWINPLDHLGYGREDDDEAMLRVRVIFPAPLEVVLCPLGEASESNIRRAPPDGDRWCSRCEALIEYEGR